ncbi:class I SAM-dependent methyltransferase [Actinomadura barringtoniae]|uniref:Class I SAM-dependent methyltransferase n=1 Tax=Actinomadura barringtoniae TaxID=1427535 RepID=A0A939PMR8_9ACTN|nr:class I SAM-dependent methyltransferase [Actinomadura barringtoniae]MBO2451426.1 class I SAM-dependent methyltransferase [Actinomadura barringtoniae]
MSTRDSYDEVAGEYAERLQDELAAKPLDRALLKLLADSVSGPIADIGCGPGHVAAHLHGLGTPVLGIDLSPRMIEIASASHPGIGFHTGDMRELHVPDQAWSGIVALYSIIHIPPADLPRAFAEFYRVLKPSGVLLLAFHLGDEVRHMDEWWGHQVSLDFQFYLRPEIETALTDAGFTVDAYIERKPYAHEAETTRAYLMAHR